MLDYLLVLAVIYDPVAVNLIVSEYFIINFFKLIILRIIGGIGKAFGDLICCLIRIKRMDDNLLITFFISLYKATQIPFFHPLFHFHDPQLT